MFAAAVYVNHHRIIPCRRGLATFNVRLVVPAPGVPWSFNGTHFLTQPNASLVLLTVQLNQPVIFIRF